ncbi:hypothetical protein GCM10007425_31080 [Lysinibacillus alkalisoli]|uniref:Peptidase S8/S53 domain-containing protein n=1 Tax=Lysinibacillus alkalisoli TaxID=1911548 RepID=A0A917LK24_9BACI|nr:hypothetical protein [Lysinibacillus alkalisoli]GGG34138.1 hypothetical protein GCM10007425_31080 [Lysinibacillus alkalisoli]
MISKIFKKSYIIIVIMIISICLVTTYTLKNRDRTVNFKLNYQALLQQPNIKNIKLAVLDDGINLQLFKDLNITKYDFTGISELHSDNLSHGTAVTGLIVETAHIDSTTDSTFAPRNV